MPCTTSRRKRVRFSKLAAVTAFTGVRAEKLMPEITVAVFYVYEVEAESLRHPGRAMEALDDVLISASLSIGYSAVNPIADRESDDGRESWLGAAMCVGAAVSPGICELKADQNPRRPGGGRCSSISVVRSFARPARYAAPPAVDWVGTSCVGNRYCFAPPDQFRAAAAEALPAPDCVRARIAIGQAIPAFHGLYRDPIADFISLRTKRWRSGDSRLSENVSSHGRPNERM